MLTLGLILISLGLVFYFASEEYVRVSSLPKFDVYKYLFFMVGSFTITGFLFAIMFFMLKGSEVLG